MIEQTSNIKAAPIIPDSPFLVWLDPASTEEEILQWQHIKRNFDAH